MTSMFFHRLVMAEQLIKGDASKVKLVRVLPLLRL